MLSNQDTTPKATGIGGIFFFSENPERIKDWYSENLGLEVNRPITQYLVVEH